jgi:predicted transcriptional regulator
VGKKRGISPNTVGSALERLHKKNLLAREKVSHAYRYRAALDREAFRARRLLEAAGGLRALGKGGLLAAFVDLVADADGSALRELERLIRRKREESEG